MMKKLFLVCCVAMLCSFTPGGAGSLPDDKGFPSLLSGSSTPAASKLVDSLYHTIKLDSLGLRKDIFFDAYKGYEFLLAKGMLQNNRILSICDYSQSSHNKRLYIIDLAAGTVIYNTYVSHGKNSGGEFASSFSNSVNSHKSSIGFLITGDTYRGDKGYSMHFDGVEPGFNDKVRKRDIVMHGSWYVNEKRADEGSMMGRSYGCTAVSYSIYKPIIDSIKNGSCFFIYGNDEHYLQASQILNANFPWPAIQSALPALPSISQLSKKEPNPGIPATETLAGK